MGALRTGGLLGLALSACGSSVMEDGGAGARGGAGGAAATEPAVGASGHVAASSSATSGTGGAPGEGTPYAYCEWEGPGGYEMFCQPTYNGFGYINWHVDGSTGTLCNNGPDCNACLCYAACGTVTGPDGQKFEASCPLPETGTAGPECLGPPTTIGNCVLTCDGGEQCPTGMTCVQNPEWNRSVCAWVKPP